MEPLTDEQKVARVRRYLNDQERRVFPPSDILGVAGRMADQWHLAAFPRAVANRLRTTYRYEHPRW